MNTGRASPQVWTHGLTALILALFMLGVSSGLGTLKVVADTWSAVLAIPEYPAVIMRSAYLSWRQRDYSIDRLNEEVSRLRRENAELRLLVSQHIGTLPTLSGDRTARVTLRAPMSWWSEIRIDRGSSDGVAQGMPVYAEGYLVGRVSTVSGMSSWVELITSGSLMIPAVIEETRELGVVAGDGTGAVLLRYIPVGRNSRVGMSVTTAMVGEQLPPGMPIGKIAGEYAAGNDGYATYRIEPGADMSRFWAVNY